METSEQCMYCHCSVVFIANFEQISHITLLFTLLILNKQMPARNCSAEHLQLAASASTENSQFFICKKPVLFFIRIEVYGQHLQNAFDNNSR